MENKRRFERVEFVTVSKVQKEGKVVAGNLLNLSLNGALIAFDEEFLNKGDKCVVSFNLAGSDIVLTFNAEAVHCDKMHVGFRFDSSDAESLTHLRRLLEFNLGDGNEIYNELSFLVKD